MEQIKIEVGVESFVCHRCKGEFDETQGTWLPVGETEPQFMNQVSGHIPDVGDTRFFAWDLRPPEVITSEEFTCYDCLEENDGKRPDGTYWGEFDIVLEVTP